MDNQDFSQLNQPSQAWTESQDPALITGTQSSLIPGTQFSVQ
jgi:hypothetical protein